LISRSSGIAVYVWVIGPHGAGKTRLLRLLHALCRGAVMASDVRKALYSVPSAITPTLLIDEFEAGGQVIGIGSGFCEAEARVIDMLFEVPTFMAHFVPRW
jgi:hypothetical protein